MRAACVCERESRRNVSWLESRGVSLVCRGIRGEFEIMLRRAAAFPVGDTSDRIPTETNTSDSQALSQSKNKWAELWNADTWEIAHAASSPRSRPTPAWLREEVFIKLKRGANTGSSEMRAPAKNSHLRAPGRPNHRPYQLHLARVRPTALQLMHKEKKRKN